MNIDTANRLVEHRKIRNYSQEELSSMLGVSRQAVSKWERGEASPDTDKLIALAGVYQISMDELLGLAPISEPTAIPPVEAEPVEKAPVDVLDAVLPVGLKHIAVMPAPTAVPATRGHLSSGAQLLIKMVGVVFWAFFFVIYGVLSMFFPQLKSAYPVICTLIYLIMGFGFSWWHPGWIIFLTIPLLFTMF